jgi:hypothetical protein
VNATSAQLRVEGVDHIRVEVSHLDVPDEGLHMDPNVAAIGSQRGSFSDPLIEVAVKQLRDGGGRTRVATLVDLI